MSTERFETFEQFFPYYLQEHAKAATRFWHYVGTALVLFVAAIAIVRGQFLLLLMMPVCGYFFAWVSHAFVERNKPATFTYPLWSLRGDFLMFFLALTGRLKPHLTAAGVLPASPPSVQQNG